MNVKPTPGRDRKPGEAGARERAAKDRLLSSIRAHLPELENLLQRASEYLVDPKDAHLVGMPFSAIHRRWRRLIVRAFTALHDLMPDCPLTDPFRTMVEQAILRDYDLTAKAIEARGSKMNKALVYTFGYLAIACRKGRELEDQPGEADEDWESLLRIFGLK